MRRVGRPIPVLLGEPEFLLILQRAKPRRGTEIVITGEQRVLPLLQGVSRSQRFPRAVCHAPHRPVCLSSLPRSTCPIQPVFIPRDVLKGRDTAD